MRLDKFAIKINEPEESGKYPGKIVIMGRKNPTPTDQRLLQRRRRKKKYAATSGFSPQTALRRQKLQRKCAARC